MRRATSEKDYLDDLEKFYSGYFSSILESGGAGRVMRMVHRTIEKPYTRNMYFARTLELGAGQGQHFGYVRHKFDSYFETDLRAELLPRRKGKNVEQLKVDATNLSGFEDLSVDRLVSTCLLAHLDSPLQALGEWRRVVRSGGVLSIYLPPEPGLLLRAARALTTRRRADVLGLCYDDIVAREHRYHFEYLRSILMTSFAADTVKLRGYPLPGLGWNSSLWFVAHILRK